MATVTKLKAAVDNKNLPILGNDGNMYNYYVGRYSNKMSELGYSLTPDEKIALDNFINAGINDGWIDKVFYFMPLIGTEATPLQGMVPLIDRIADYELAVNDVSGLFSFDNGKIKSLGGSSTLKGSAELPFTSFDFDVPQCFSLFINVNYLAANGDDVDGLQGTYCYAYNTKPRFSLRKGFVGSTDFALGYRNSSDTDLSAVPIANTAYENDGQLGIFACLYKDTNDTVTRKSYSMKKGSGTLRGISTTVSFIPPQQSTYFIGSSTTSRGMNTVVNCMAVLTSNVTTSDLSRFNQAVFALTTALGRDIPTT